MQTLGSAAIASISSSVISSGSLYAIAGDMFRGSVIDSEYKGLSTIEIMNALAPDIVTIGNHEVDYYVYGRAGL